MVKNSEKLFNNIQFYQVNDSRTLNYMDNSENLNKNDLENIDESMA
jgi:hypothetical protein